MLGRISQELFNWSIQRYLTAIRTYFTEVANSVRIHTTSLVRFSTICLNPTDRVGLGAGLGVGHSY